MIGWKIPVAVAAAALVAGVAVLSNEVIGSPDARATRPSARGGPAAAAMAASCLRRERSHRALGHVLFADRFRRPNGANHLITNEYALFNPHDRRAVSSSEWEMTSGSLFSVDGVGWTGHPDTVTPNADSTNGTDSAVFRLRTRLATFRDVRVDVDVRVNRWVIGAGRESQEPEVVIWMRYASEFQLYWASVLRATGRVDVEKKVPVGPCGAGDANCYNAGDYYILPPYTQAGWHVTFGRWYHITATAEDNPDGSVTITTYRDGIRMIRAVDRGRGSTVRGAGDGQPLSDPAPPIVGPARLGIRGDNADFNLRDYTVTALCG
jgi:hypothetical protein